MWVENIVKGMKFFFAGILGALALNLGACGSDDKSSAAPMDELSSGSEDYLFSSGEENSNGLVSGSSDSSVDSLAVTSSNSLTSSAEDLSAGSATDPTADTVVALKNPPVIFTEVDLVNLSYKDEEGGDAGWVEVYNPADTAVNLKGYYLTNSKAEQTKFQFGNVVVQPKSHMIVYLSGRNLPDYVAPHDTVNLLSSYCEGETDAVNYPGRGASEIKPLDGASDFCFVENGVNRAGAQMIPVKSSLGYYVLSLTIGSTNEGKVPVDLSKANQFQLKAYIPKDHEVYFKILQKGFREIKSWNKMLVGTGDSNTVYSIRPPLHSDYPNLAEITGLRLDKDYHDSLATDIKVFSYIAYSRGYEPHANFKSKKEGGSLYLFNGEMQLVDSVMYPAAVIGKTWSREIAAVNGVVAGAVTSTSAKWGFANATPYGETVGAVENAPQTVKTEFPNSGFYSAPFSIAFGTDDEIRCEKGGTVPTATSPLMVTSLKIDTTTVLRCATFENGAVPGNVINRTYVFEDQPTVASVFITGDPLQMFHADSGLFMNENFWGDKEIPVNIELLEAGQKVSGFSENAGLAISGNATRTWAKKSVEITFREKYGKNKLDYVLFPEFPDLKKFKSFKLRNNGNNYHFDYIRDMLASSITEGLGIDYQHGRASIVFYNGEYYGIHNIRESSNKNYYLAKYNLDGDQVDILNSSAESITGSPVDFIALTNFLLTKTMTDEDVATVNEQMDLNNFINYYAAEIFANNRDWPGNNRKIWRAKNPKTPWKWFMYDTDMAFDNSQTDKQENLKGNIFEFVTAANSGWPNNPEFTQHLRMLLKNENFKAAFINQIAAILCMNFSAERVVARMEKLNGAITAEVSRDQKRWSKNVATMTEHEGRIKTFATTRQDVVRNEMKEHFALGEMVDVTIASSGNGNVQVHYLPLDKSSLKIKFFKGTPVTLTAVPKDGGIFIGWSDGVKDATRTIDPEDGLKITANFK